MMAVPPPPPPLDGNAIGTFSAPRILAPPVEDELRDGGRVAVSPGENTFWFPQHTEFTSTVTALLRGPSLPMVLGHGFSASAASASPASSPSERGGHPAAPRTVRSCSVVNGHENVW